jgi:hypothetical protein
MNNVFIGAIKGLEFEHLELGIKDLRTYLFGLLFISGNIALPWLCHQFNLGGPMFLPIYFFALIAGYKYGYTVGILTALSSPLANTFLTGMPPVYLIPIITFKSLLLAVCSAYIAKRSKKISLFNLLMVVLSYQLISSVIVFLVTGNKALAVSDLIVGYPGLIVQILGGFFILNGCTRRTQISKIKQKNAGVNN